MADTNNLLLLDYDHLFVQVSWPTMRSNEHFLIRFGVNREIKYGSRNGE